MAASARSLSELSATFSMTTARNDFSAADDTGTLAPRTRTRMPDAASARVRLSGRPADVRTRISAGPAASVTAAARLFSGRVSPSTDAVTR